jgi:nitrous oxide reductase accessory protein NosL
MGHGIVAFADAATAAAFATRQGGEIVALEDLVRRPDRLALGREPKKAEGHP